MTALISNNSLMKIARVIGGDWAVQIVKILHEIGEATVDQIMAKTGIALNDIRKTLFKLYDQSIVQCSSQRDQDTGWFIFRWRLQPDQMEGFIQNQKVRILRILESRLNYERSHNFYYCLTSSCNRMTFEDAMEVIFNCPMCGKSLQYFENSQIIMVLEEKIQELRKELGE